MADERVGFVIEDRFYPFPVSFRLADPVLVEELTGLGWDEFVDRLPSGEDSADGQGTDPVAMVGLVGVAVWQQNPRWRRDRVLRFIQSIEQNAIEFEAPDEEANGGPPAKTAGGKTSGPSASKSGSGSESTSSMPSLESSGTPPSPTSPEEQSG